MAWQCELCGKTFAKTNQGHHCVQISLETLLSRQHPAIKTLVQEILAILAHELTFIITQSEKAITLYTPAHKAFLVLSPKKKWVDAWFTLAYTRDEFPVFKIVQTARHKYAHFVRFQAAEELDHSLLKWLNEAWQLNH
jgi:hypothetical protein